MSLMLGLDPDPKLVKEVAEYKQLMKSVKTVGEEFNDLLSELKKIKITPQPEVPLDVPKPPTVDELLLEFSNKETPDVEEEKPDVSIPKPPSLEELMEVVGFVEDKEEKKFKSKLIELASKHITKETQFEEKGTFTQPEVPLTKSLEDIKKKLLFLEQWVAKISSTGPGSGEVRLLNLDDVDTAAIGDNKYLKYNQANGKLEFATVSGGGGGSVDSVNGETGTVVLTTANIAESGNLYFTNSRVVSALTAGNNIVIEANGLISANVSGGGSVDFTSVSSNIIPSANSVFNLGSPENRWKTLFLANNTIDLGGALIQSDGTGAIIISSTGAVLPRNSKVSTGNENRQIALLGNTSTITSLVPFFTQELGLNTPAAEFTFGFNPDDYVFTNFTLSNGASLTQAGIAQFYF